MREKNRLPSSNPFPLSRYPGGQYGDGRPLARRAVAPLHGIAGFVHRGIGPVERDTLPGGHLGCQVCRRRGDVHDHAVATSNDTVRLLPTATLCPPFNGETADTAAISTRRSTASTTGLMPTLTFRCDRTFSPMLRSHGTVSNPAEFESEVRELCHSFCSAVPVPGLV